VIGDSIAVVEMKMLVGVQFDLAVVVEAEHGLGIIPVMIFPVRIVRETVEHGLLVGSRIHLEHRSEPEAPPWLVVLYRLPAGSLITPAYGLSPFAPPVRL
jgi:hypothetical protein